MFWAVVIFLFLPFIFFSINKDIKQSNNFGFLLLFVLFSIFSFNNGNQDYQAYLNIFDEPESYGEIGYLFLVNLVKIFEGSHSAIVFIVGLLLLFTFYRLIKNFKANLSIICILYFIYPFIFDITQIRNTIMLCLVMNGLIEIYNNKLTKGLFIILIGCFFHNFGIIYFLIIFIYKSYNKNILKLFTVGVGLVFLLPIFFTFILPVIPILRVQALVANYLSDSIKLHSLVIWGVDYFIFICIAFYLREYVAKKNGYNVKFYENVEFLFKILLIHIIFLGFLMYFFEFNRVYRNSFILKYLYLSVCLQYLPYRIKIKIAIYIFINASIFSYLSTINLDNSYSYDEILVSNILLDLF